MGRDLVIGLSLANLCLMKASLYIHFYLSNYYLYYSEMPQNMNHYFAFILNVFLLAIFFWGAMTLVRKTRNQKVIEVAKVVFLLMLIIPLNIIILFFRLGCNDNYHKILYLVFILIFIILSIRMYIKFRKQVISLPVKVVLILFPLFLYNLSAPAIKYLKINPSDFTDNPQAEAVTVKNQTKNRILWIIFDEMDQRLTFEDRPSDLKLPEIDRFRSEALYAENAYPPGGETLISLPSLITGKIVSEVKFTNPNDLLINISNENQFVGWSTVANIFSRVNDLGMNTALIGFCHPYNRVIGNSITYCTWRCHENYRYISFSEAMAQQVVATLQSIPLSSRFTFLTKIYDSKEFKQKYRIKSYDELLNESKEAAVNPKFGLILVHLPVPHPPGFYDRAQNDFSIDGGGYMDNLALADRALGEIRSSMESSGTWDNTTVIITSDHWLRTKIYTPEELRLNKNDAAPFNNGLDYRIPFLIKLAGKKESLNYDQPFNTIITHDLILALLNNELSSVDDVAKWIDIELSDWWIPDYNNSQYGDSS